MNVEEESIAAIFLCVCVCGQTASTTEISLWEGMKRHQEAASNKIRGNDTLVMVAHDNNGGT